MNQANGLRFTFRVADLPDGTVDVVGFKLDEQLSAPFKLTLDLTSGDRIPEAADLMEQAAELGIWQQGELRRCVQGVITRIERYRSEPRVESLRVTVEPPLARLRLMRNCRIFQQLSAPEIIEALLEERGIHAFRFNLREEHPPRTYCVQYRETDLEFLQRLAGEEGIHYRFDLEDEQAQLIFEDDVAAGPDLGTQPYEPNAGGDTPEPIIKAFATGQQLAPASTALHHYDFERPDTALMYRDEARGLKAQRDDYAWYDHPGRNEASVAQQSARNRLEGLRRDAHASKGSGQIARFRPGAGLVLDHDLIEGDEAEWRLIRVIHVGEQKQALEENAGDGKTTYSNDFFAVPERSGWRPGHPPPPAILGPQSALVSGPEGEEIHCDEHGRVKVRFPWDRDGENDEKSSAWLRVAQRWAGAGHGQVALPRIGEEVLVSFIDGDPDQPVVTGRLHNGPNVPPLDLPAEKTRTVWRSQTHQGEGHNELSFDDATDNERVSLHAQRDLAIHVGEDRTERIDHDSHSQIDGNRYQQTGGDNHRITDGDHLASTGGDLSLQVDGSLQLKAGKAWLSDAGTELHIKAGQKAVIEAGTELTLNAGGSFLKLDPSGVTLMGPTIKLNAGGAPGVGSGQQAEAPEAPMQFDPKKPEQVEQVALPQHEARPVFSASAAQALKLATENRSGIVEECQRQEDGSCPLDDCPCDTREGAPA